VDDSRTHGHKAQRSGLLKKRVVLFYMTSRVT